MKILYLHGFASGPNSKKGVELDKHLSPKHGFERLNLRVPSFEHLRLSAMIDTVLRAIDRDVIIIGSSLGGLTAARVAERDDRVKACVLFAPAFQLAARWRESLGAEWDAWRSRGFREVLDFTTGEKVQVDFGFIEDAERVDVGYPEVRVPTLILHGIHDEAVPIQRSRTFAAGKPHVRLVELDDGHELIASLPTLVVETESFLDGLGS